MRGEIVTKIQINKKALALFLLWLRGPLSVILSIIMLIGFLVLGAIPIAVSVFEISWTKAFVRLLISSFLLSFGSFLLIVFYEKRIRRLS